MYLMDKMGLVRHAAEDNVIAFFNSRKPVRSLRVRMRNLDRQPRDSNGRHRDSRKMERDGCIRHRVAACVADMALHTPKARNHGCRLLLLRARVSDHDQGYENADCK